MRRKYKFPAHVFMISCLCFACFLRMFFSFPAQGIFMYSGRPFWAGYCFLFLMLIYCYSACSSNVCVFRMTIILSLMDGVNPSGWPKTDCGDGRGSSVLMGVTLGAFPNPILVMQSQQLSRLQQAMLNKLISMSGYFYNCVHFKCVLIVVI